MHRRALRVVLIGAVMAFAVALFASGSYSADAGSNTASFNAAARAQLSIVSITDGGVPLTSLPPGLTVNPSENGGPTTNEQSGTGQLTFGGTFTTAGSGLASTVDLDADVSGTATPAGVADGFETAAGGIQIINNTQSTLVVTMQFDGQASASATVTDPALESVSNVFYDVEFSQSLGGSATSPCITGIVVEEELFPFVGAPPDTTSPAVAPSIQHSATLPPGETCSFNVLVQVGGRAEAQPMPTAIPPPTTVSTATAVPTATSTPTAVPTVSPTATSTSLPAATTQPAATVAPAGTASPQASAAIAAAPDPTSTPAPSPAATPTAAPTAASAPPAFTG